MPDELSDFIRKRVRSDLENDLIPNAVTTRFPPEPNGYLHIGHAKSICLNFGVAREFTGQTYLRFDDTNPLKESEEFVEAIQDDVRWLGFSWGQRLTFASDYFQELYDFAQELIRRDKAFVCDLSQEEIRATRGTLTEPGTDSPYRNRSIEENQDLFARMRDGEFPEGSRVLRAKIDMQSPNVNMRDPVIYRILHAEHHRTGDAWCVYPMYDFTHCICDALEGITHSLCTLEFEDHRPLYDWVLDNININFHPPQIEFSRLGLEYNVMSKRILTELVDRGVVSGWDDPRLPTIAGLRRRGIPAGAIREFCRRIGITKQENLVETELLDFCVRNELEDTSPRAMAVLDPLPVEITNFEGSEIELEAGWHPKNDELGNRTLTFGSTIYIDRSDFAEQPPPKFRRLTLGGLVRLRYAFIIRCDEVVKDSTGRITGLKATYFPESRSGQDKSGLKPKGVIQFVSSSNAESVLVRLYDRLFTVVNPTLASVEDALNENSLVEKKAFVERAAIDAGYERLQFERVGYFYRDPTIKDDVVFNRTAALASGWKPTT